MKPFKITGPSFIRRESTAVHALRKMEEAARKGERERVAKWLDEEWDNCGPECASFRAGQALAQAIRDGAHNEEKP